MLLDLDSEARFCYTAGMSKPKDKPAATVNLGGENVRLFLRPGNGAEFFLAPDDGGTPRVVVGTCGGSRDFQRVCGALAHELFELVASRQGHRYDKAPLRSSSHASYWFMFDHEEMDYMVQSVARALVDVMPLLKKALK